MNEAAFLEGVWVNAPASWSAVAVTPLWNDLASWRAITECESGVALRLPPHSTTWRRLERAIEYSKTS